MAKVTVEFDHDIPDAKSHPNWSTLYKEVTSYVETIRKGKRPYKMDDWPHWLFEAAIEAVYGKDVWDAINERDGYLEYEE